MSLKYGIPGLTLRKFRRNFFFIFKLFRHRMFNQTLKSASDREFYSLYDAIRQFTKFGFLVS
jgi:hypothetical protein